VNEQSRASSTGVDAVGAARGAGAVKRSQAEDAWDRLAALAFGGAASAGGCSEHAHDLECTCAGEQVFAGMRERGELRDCACAGDGAELGEGSSVPPGDRRGVYADPEMETAD